MPTLANLMSLQQANDLLHAHAWRALFFLLAPLLIGYLVRLSKDDAIGPVVPAKYRPLLAYTLGAAGAVVDALSGGVPTTEIIFGFGAPTLAILGHILGIEGLRGGAEIPLPVFLGGKPGKPPTGPASVLLVLLLSASAIVISCGGINRQVCYAAAEAHAADDGQRSCFARGYKWDACPDQKRILSELSGAYRGCP